MTRTGLREALQIKQASLGRFVKLRGQFVRYGLSSGLLLLAKMCLTYLLIQLLDAWAAYFVVHVLIFFLSYKLHSLVTFRRPLSWLGMRRYFAAVIAFKAFDYGVFNLLFVSWEITATWCVVLASLSEAALRFVMVRKALRCDVQIRDVQVRDVQISDVQSGAAEGQPAN